MASPELDSRFDEVNEAESDPAAHVACIAALSEIPAARDRMKSLIPRLVGYLKPGSRALWKETYRALANICEKNDVNVRFVNTLAKPSELFGVCLKETLLEPSDDLFELRHALTFLAHLVKGSISVRYAAEDAGLGKLLFQLLEPRVIASLEAFRQLDTPSTPDAADQVDPSGVISACLDAVSGLMLSKISCRDFLRLGLLRVCHLVLKGAAKVSEGVFVSVCNVLVVSDFSTLMGLDNRRQFLWRFMREYFEDPGLLRRLSDKWFGQLLNTLFTLDKGSVYQSTERFKTLFEFGIVDILFEMMGVAGTENGMTKPQVRLFLQYIVQLCDQKSLLQALYDRDIVGSMKKLFADMEMAKEIVDTFRFLATYDEDGEHAQDWLADPDVMDYFGRMLDVVEDVELKKSATTLVGNLARNPLVVAQFVTEGFHRNLERSIRYSLEALQTVSAATADGADEGEVDAPDMHGLLFRGVFALSGIIERAKPHHLDLLFDADHIDTLLIELLHPSAPLICHFYLSHALLQLVQIHPPLARSLVAKNYGTLLGCFVKQGQHYRVRLDLLKILGANLEWDEELRGRLLSDEVFSIIRLLMNSGIQDDIILKVCRALMMHDDGPPEDSEEAGEIE